MEKDYVKLSTGAARESIGTKIDTHLVPYELSCAAAIGLNYGEVKYAARNYEKGLSYRSLCGSIERHNRAILDGEYIDAPSGIPHFALLASSVAMLCHNIMQEVIVDDRAEPKQGQDIGMIAANARYLEQQAENYRIPPEPISPPWPVSDAPYAPKKEPK